MHHQHRGKLHAGILGNLLAHQLRQLEGRHTLRDGEAAGHAVEQGALERGCGLACLQRGSICGSLNDQHRGGGTGGTHRDQGGAAHLRQRLGGLLSRNRGQHTLGGQQHVGEATLNPETTRSVQVPNVTGMMPTRSANGLLLGHPQGVVAVLHVRRRHQNLAGHTRLMGQLIRHRTVLQQRRNSHRRTVHREAHAHAVAGERVKHLTVSIRGALGNRLADHLERHIGHRQTLGHAVGGVQGGVRHQGGERLQQGHGNRRASAQHRLNLSQRRTLLAVQLIGGRHHIHQGGRGRKNDRRINSRRSRR